MKQISTIALSTRVIRLEDVALTVSTHLLAPVTPISLVSPVVLIVLLTIVHLTLVFTAEVVLMD